MKLKMPGPNGIITLASDPDIALHAENKTAALALEALSEALAAEELTTLRWENHTRCGIRHAGEL